MFIRYPSGRRPSLAARGLLLRQNSRALCLHGLRKLHRAPGAERLSSAKPGAIRADGLLVPTLQR